MASRGARNLILLSRSGGKSEEGQLLLQELKEKGVHVEPAACDISEAQDLQQVLGDLAEKVPPIRGCIQSSMVIRVSQQTQPRPCRLRTNALTCLFLTRMPHLKT